MLLPTSLALTLLVQALPGEVRVPSDTSLSEVRARVLEMVRERGAPSLAVGVARRGEILWLEAIGWADRAARRPATPATAYAVGSLSKSLTAEAAIVLLERGRLSLETRVADVIPAEARPWDPDGLLPGLRLRHLLDATGGIPHGWISTSDGDGSRGGLPTHRIPIVFPPGEAFEYSNHSFGLLQAVIEGAAGADFDAALRSLVFDPLGMTASGARRDPARAVGYSAGGDPLPPARLVPAGGLGLHASAQDLLRFGMHAAVARRPPSLDASAPRDDAASDPSRGFFRLGWWTGAGRVSNGSVAGGNAHLWVEPQHGLVVVALTNQTSSLADEVAGLIADVLAPGTAEAGARARAEYARLFRTTYAPSPKWSGSWTGSIRAPALDVPIVLRMEGDVTVRIGGSAPTTLESASLNAQGELRGSLQGTIPGLTPPGSAPHPIRLVLRRTGQRLIGYASAVIDLPGANALLPASVSLERVGSDGD